MEKNKNLLVGRFKYRLVYTSRFMHQQRGSPVFEWLVRYHTQENLPRYLDYLSRQGEPVANGIENGSTTGCLILENGDMLVSKLQRERIVLDYRPPQFQPATSYEQFARFLEQHKSTDGAFFYDGKHQRMARVARYANNSPAMERVRERQASLIPADFFLYGSTNATLTEGDLDEHSGTKTDLAMVLPVAYTSPDCRVHAYQIKRTAYADSGLGKVTHFGPEGLEEEFFFKEHEGTGPVALPGFPLVGMYRRYAPRDERVHRVQEEVVNVGKLERKVA